MKPRKKDAEWRLYTDEFMESLPKKWLDAAPGDKWYFTGVECNKGHLTVRYTSSRCCAMCQAIKDRTPKAKKTRFISVMGINFNCSLSECTD